MGKTLFQKVWDRHTVGTLPDGSTQLFVGTHLIHEVTSPQAFGMLRDLGLNVAFPQRTFATVDHIVPTDQRTEPFRDSLADAMIKELRKNCDQFGVTFFDIASGKQGIVHIVGPEQGITQPGTTIACGDSHTSTHGAFGAVAFGIGTSQVRDVLATQTMALSPLKVRKIEIRGKLGPGVYAKDIILHIIRTLGVNGGTGYAYEYCGSTIEALSIEERMTICNMSIEGGARAGYVNPDEKTFEYLKGRPYCPKGKDWDVAVAEWKKVVSDANAVYDDVKIFEASEIRPTVTWGINPGQGIFIDEVIPSPEQLPEGDRSSAKEALEFMQFKAGDKLDGQKIQVAFFGSCTNARLSDLRAAAEILKGRKISPNVQAICVPGSTPVKRAAEAEGLDRIFKDAGFEWHESACGNCGHIGDDRFADLRTISTTNRNFKGRQGPNTRTHLASPVTVAASALAGSITYAVKA